MSGHDQEKDREQNLVFYLQQTPGEPIFNFLTFNSHLSKHTIKAEWYVFLWQHFQEDEFNILRFLSCFWREA